MTVIALKKSIKEDDYGKRKELPNNFGLTMNNGQSARKAVMAFKDSYLLDFINIEEIGERDLQDIDERVVEQQIIHNIKKHVYILSCTNGSV